MKKVFACIDGSEYSRDVCDYAIDIAKKLELPLVLLNAVEHTHQIVTQDLSGNIGLGTRDALLEQYTNEEMTLSKARIAEGKALLKEMREYAQEQGVEECETLQRHGSLQESLSDLSEDIKIAILGLRGKDQNSIGEHVESLLRSVSTPFLLVNSKFKPIESILMAYDGSEFANKAIEIATKSPIFPNIKRYVVNVSNDSAESRRVLSQAKNLFGESDYELEIESLSGDSVTALLEYQEKHGIDIIAMGAYSGGKLKSFIFGSFTTKMFLNAKKPLLLFR